MTVTWGKKAYDDLGGIAKYLADLSPQAAEKAVTRINLWLSKRL